MTRHTVILIAALATACSGGHGSPSGPDGSSATSPSTSLPAPEGCSGARVNRVGIQFGEAQGRPGETVTVRFTAQLAGETISGEARTGQPFQVVRDMVPCEYEITGQMLDQSLTLNFGRVGPGYYGRGRR